MMMSFISHLWNKVWSIQLEQAYKILENTYECRCNERPKTKDEGSTRLSYTGLCGGLEHLKIETRLKDESFESVQGECVI